MNKERHGMGRKATDQSTTRQDLEGIDLRTSLVHHLEWAAC